MQSQLETLGQLERRLDFAIAAADFQTAVDARLKQVARTARIQGFRPGKAPLRIVAQNYGQRVNEEVLGEKVQTALVDALQMHNLRVAGMPQIEGKPSQDGHLVFSATFEIYPDVVISDLSVCEVQRPRLEVTDAEVEKTIEILRKQRTRFNRVERPAQSGDRAIVDFVGTLDGVPFSGGSAENYAFALGAGQMLPEFDAAVQGMKEDETKTFDLTFPADYQGQDVAGKTAQFKVTVKNVAEPQLPDVDADFARALGIADGDVVKLREEIRRNVEREVRRRLNARAKEAVMDALLGAVPVEVPKVLLSEEVARLAQDAQAEFQRRGMDTSALNLPANLFEEQARKRVSMGLILAEIVRANQLSASPEQMKAAIAELSESYEQPEEVAQWYYSDRQRLAGVENQVLEDNVVAWVYSQVKAVDTEIAFDDLMGQQA